MVLRSNLLFILSSILLVSCTNDIAKHPLDWPDIETEKNTECINLNGSYLNKGVEAPTNPDHGPTYLSELLVPLIPNRQYVEHKWADTIKLKGIDNGKLEITLWEKNKQIFQTTLNNQNNFSCTSQYLLLTDTSSPDNMMGVTERFEKTKFSKGVDGSILATEQQTDIGLIVLVPYGEKTLERYRFLPVDSQK